MSAGRAGRSSRGSRGRPRGVLRRRAARAARKGGPPARGGPARAPGVCRAWRARAHLAPIVEFVSLRRTKATIDGLAVRGGRTPRDWPRFRGLSVAVRQAFRACGAERARSAQRAARGCRAGGAGGPPRAPARAGGLTSSLPKAAQRRKTPRGDRPTPACPPPPAAPRSRWGCRGSRGTGKTAAWPAGGAASARRGRARG
jgi:hypothetical protein